LHLLHYIALQGRSNLIFSIANVFIVGMGYFDITRLI